MIDQPAEKVEPTLEEIIHEPLIVTNQDELFG
jgi:hypothetical protein